MAETPDKTKSKIEQVVKDEDKKDSGVTVLLTVDDIKQLIQNIIEAEGIDEKDAFFKKWNVDQWNQLAAFSIKQSELEKSYPNDDEEQKVEEPKSDHGTGLQEPDERNDNPYESGLMEGGYHSGGWGEFDLTGLEEPLGYSRYQSPLEIAPMHGGVPSPGGYNSPSSIPEPPPGAPMGNQLGSGGTRRWLGNQIKTLRNIKKGGGFTDASNAGKKRPYIQSADGTKEWQEMANNLDCDPYRMEIVRGYIENALKEKDLAPDIKTRATLMVS
ncbi:unnamed protein product [Ambrosiozyma monospora]|uniref:Unnamed protein product n=1 Tax=Ambrosiozyma monospora TaxID=43982 RepID=A0ACB5SYA4_AMBMO|nr:unnamed protein product [Ambrosiozyma monospora]